MKAYSHEHLRCVAMPLGGIGTGHFCICGDGSFRQWQIANRIKHTAFLPGTFFAIADHSSGMITKLICDKYWDEPFEPAPGISDHLIPGQLRREMDGYQCADDVTFSATYPIAKLQFGLPNGIHCAITALSPFEPFDHDKSSIPCAMFEIQVENRSSQDMLLALVASLQNCIGWDLEQEITGVSHPNYGGNTNQPIQNGIVMRSTALPAEHPFNGELALHLSESSRILPCWQQPPELHAFVFENAATIAAPSKPGYTWNGAVARDIRLSIGETVTVRSIISWRFPNRFVDFQQNERLVPKGTAQHLGNHYCARFATAAAAAQYASNNWDSILRTAKEYVGAFDESSIDAAVIQAITANTSTLRSAVCMRTADGFFHGFEGACGAFSGGPDAIGGCCPMDCTHVWNYDQTLLHLWPELHRTMRESDWLHNQNAKGYLPHRTILPLAAPRYWEMEIGGPLNPAIDGLFAGVLKTYQQWRTYENEEWLNGILPHARGAMEYAIAIHDCEGDGVIHGEQPNTYDIHLYGPNTFIGTQYLAALLASEQMFAHDHEFAKLCRSRFENGSENYDKLCWNGSYYRQVIEMNERDYQFGEGCMSDQLLGQWWAHICGLGYVLNPERVRQAVKTIFETNYKHVTKETLQKPRQYAVAGERGLFNATYPQGTRPRVPLEYSDEIWSGVEYAFASLLIYEGFIEEACEIVRSARSRYDGRIRNPFNEIECGDHYVRPLSSFSLLLALTGMQYSRMTNTLSFRMHETVLPIEVPFFAGECFGTVKIDRELKTDIKLLNGRLFLKELSVSVGDKTNTFQNVELS